MDVSDDETTSLLSAPKGNAIEMTVTRTAVPDALKVPQPIKDMLQDFRPSYVCAGDNTPDKSSQLTFIHFIYSSKEKAQAAAKSLFDKNQIFYADRSDVFTKTRPVNVHTKAPNCSDYYQEKGFAFFRVHVSQFDAVFPSFQKDQLLRRSEFEKQLTEYENSYGLARYQVGDGATDLDGNDAPLFDNNDRCVIF